MSITGIRRGEKQKQIHACIPEPIHQKLAQRAKRNHRTITGEAIAILDQELQHEEAILSKVQVGVVS